MKIIEADSSRIAGWLNMRLALWPECPRIESEKEIERVLNSNREAAFLAVQENGSVAGFAEVSLREYVDGCSTQPVGYLEGIYVAPEYRKRGIARKLIQACEAWATTRGCTEMGSDAKIDDDQSISFHKFLGFKETERQVVFLKKIK